MSEGDDATMPDTRPNAPSATRLRATELGDRYEVQHLLGRGGMGEVRLARDKRIDRDVAVKTLRDSGADEAMMMRFFREARVQGRLDHPAIVPIHDLGIDDHGNPYFVMKRLEGTTLADLLATTDPELREKGPRRKLLTRLVDICLAIQFAHERDVIHRDLKPGNIMLGEHGEAYVLDWGLARVIGDRRIEGDSATPAVDEPAATQAGELMGTPGYMSPEQARGEQIDGRTDTFALGCVLYEILTGTPALPRGVAGIQATIDVVALKPSDRLPDVPPELDALCVRATSGDRTNRMSPGELADGIQNYLDGDRDMAARKQRAVALATSAKAALDPVIEGTLKGATANEARAVAMRDAGHALALDPSNTVAADITAYLGQVPPEEIPAEALATADHERALARQHVLRWARGAIGLLIGFELLLLFVPLHHTWPVVVLFVVSIPVWIVTDLMARRTLPMSSPWFLVYIVLTGLMVTAGGVVVGPLFVLPMFVIGAMGAYVAQPSSFSPLIVIGCLLAPIPILVVLETIGVLPSTFEFRDGSFVLSTWVFDLEPTVAIILLVSSIIIQTINSTVVLVFQRKAQEKAQNLVHAHQWHLKKLLPDSDKKSAGS